METVDESATGSVYSFLGRRTSISSRPTSRDLQGLPWLAVSASPPVETSDGAQVPDLSVDELPREAWLDRDLSWLEFNGRVLHEALDDRTPLLERVKFLAIFSSNLDEFFMKRMALIRPMTDDTSLAAQERRELLSGRGR